MSNIGIINIGPWWLWDIMCLGTIIGSLIFGIRRGFFATLYFLLIEVIAVILMMFVPTLLTNATAQPIIKLLGKTGIVGVFESMGSSVGATFSELLKAITKVEDFPTLSWSGLGTETLKIFVALILYLIYCVLVFAIVNIIGFSTYRGVRKKLRRLKIVGSADALLGAINGLSIGMIFTMILTTFFSLPIFATEHQRLETLDFEKLTEEQKVDWVKYGNSFNRYSIAKKITTNVPTIPIAKFMYTNACVNKYLVSPLLTLSNQATSSGNGIDGIKQLPSDIFDTYAQLMLEGYSSNNPLKAPIATCIDLMPEDTRNLFRITSETLLSSIDLFDQYMTTDEGARNGTIISSSQIMNALEDYRNAKNIELTSENTSLMTPSSFRDFYKWTKDNGIENPFMTLADHYDSLDKYQANHLLAKILRSPNRTYSLMRNIFYVNQNAMTNLDVPLFIPSYWSTSWLANGMEMSYNGGILSNYFKKGVTDDWETNLNDNSKWLITKNNSMLKADYDGFWLRYYFDYATIGGY
ncbi:hypothetical protein SCHIN_v1c08880 [Spiroplasma chinense]|uniref:Uncharacterized protein n=1 Tax=Spiroplasma chinense TaxID=216932 RepID=A0A5B9Y5K7_9MOLU|nr:hypothetical protein [Spiroplasma chinense]QEH62083.1 hypothetical protein SCHIN_v1c08880 [Spiroplasma chinense]